MSVKTKATWIVVFSNVIYGCSFLATTMALRESGNAYYSTVALRFAFAVIALSILLLTGVIKVNYKKKPVYKLVLVALVYPGIYFLCETVSVGNISTAVVGVSIGATPILVALFSWIFLRRKQTPLQLLFVVISIAGVALLNLEGFNAKPISPLYALTLFGAVAALAAYSVLVNYLSREFTPAEITFAMLFIGMVLFGGLALFTNGPQAILANIANPAYLLPVLFLGVFTSATASFALNYGLCRLPAVQVSVLNNVTSVISVLCGVIVLREQMTPLGLLGCVIVISGCLGYTLMPKPGSCATQGGI